MYIVKSVGVHGIAACAIASLFTAVYLTSDRGVIGLKVIPKVVCFMHPYFHSIWK
jgi:hypothetical protein